MNPQAESHKLTTEQLDAQLAHPELTQTPEDPELAALRVILQDLRDTTTAAAEEHYRKAVVPAPRRAVSSLSWVFATAALIVCIAGPLSFQRRQPKQPVAVATTSQAAPTMSDEVLLADIQSDLDDSVPAPLLPLSTDTTASDSSQAQTSTQRNAQ